MAGAGGGVGRRLVPGGTKWSTGARLPAGGMGTGQTTSLPSGVRCPEPCQGREWAGYPSATEPKGDALEPTVERGREGRTTVAEAFAKGQGLEAV